MHSLKLPHWGNSNEYTEHTIFYTSQKTHSKIITVCLLPMIHPQWLKLPMSRTISIVPKMFEPLWFHRIYILRFSTLSDTSPKMSDIFLFHKNHHLDINQTVCWKVAIFLRWITKIFLILPAFIYSQQVKVCFQLWNLSNRFVQSCAIFLFSGWFNKQNSSINHFYSSVHKHKKKCFIYSEFKQPNPQVDHFIVKRGNWEGVG